MGAVRQEYGAVTLSGASFQKTYPGRRRADYGPINYNSPRRDFKFELFPLHSQLLGESLLVSFPPDSDMLKSTGYSVKSEAKRS